MLRNQSSRPNSNFWEGGKHLCVEGCKRKVLPDCKFDEQGIVDSDPGLNRSFESTVPQCIACDGLDPQLGGEAEALPAFLGRNHLGAYGHPNVTVRPRTS